MEKKQETNTTTDLGVRSERDDASLRVTPNGPLLLAQDFIARQKITHFDHERIPERVVHARGSGAYGVFQTTASMKEFTSMRLFQELNTKCDVFVRFSQAIGNLGSADTSRDVRGFATKFYTTEGNYDIVGNNFPLFIIRDFMKFPDFVHASRPENDSSMPNDSSAHSTFWDFVACSPETHHHVLWQMSDRGIPRSYRMMEGFSINTFQFCNGTSGKAYLVRFHWKPLLGVHCLTWEEAMEIRGSDPDFLRRDLWDSIESENYPQWNLGVQLLPLESDNQKLLGFNPLDPTKFWPEEQVPVKIIGIMTLNRNVTDFLAETEQVAFCPGNLVNGIELSDDPILQGRAFSYMDTQLKRLGGPNFNQIPINQPKNAVISNNQRGGHMQMMTTSGRVNYNPSMLPREGVSETDVNPYANTHSKVQGRIFREPLTPVGPIGSDEHCQARIFFKSLAKWEQKHIEEALCFELSKVPEVEIRNAIVQDFLALIDNDLACNVAKFLGVACPSTTVPEIPSGFSLSPSLSLESTVKSAKTMKVACLVGSSRSDSPIVKQMMKALKTVGSIPVMVSILNAAPVNGEGTSISLVSTKSSEFDGVFVSSGIEISKLSMEVIPDLTIFITQAFRHYKPICCEPGSLKLLPKGAEKQPGVVIVNEKNDVDSFIQALKIMRFWERQVCPTSEP